MEIKKYRDKGLLSLLCNRAHVYCSHTTVIPTLLPHNVSNKTQPHSRATLKLAAAPSKGIFLWLQGGKA